MLYTDSFNMLGSVFATPFGLSGSVSKDGGLIKDHDTHYNPIRLVRMVEKIECKVPRL